MTLELYSTLLTLGSIGIFIILLGVGIGYIFSVKIRQCMQRISYEQYLIALATISIVSIAGSLIYQLVYMTPVCELCWWQRIFLYPVSVIAIVALWFRTRESHITIAILSAFGLWYASYHYYFHFQGYVLGNKLSIPCSYGGLMPACTNSPVLVFGFATIPFMGIMIFGSMIILAALAHTKLETSLWEKLMKTFKSNS
ncbi:MAG: disulfide bond formation protein B [Minisyncoccota bacterium]